MNGVELQKILSDWSGEALGNEEYFTFGDPLSPIKAMTVSWCIDDETIDFAVKNKCNYILHHESLLHPYPLEGAPFEREYLGWRVNSHKLARLAENNINTFRLHWTMDKLTIFYALAGLLNFAPVHNDGFEDIFISPCKTARELAAHVKKIMKMDAIRCAGNMDQNISRIGLAWGGMGLFLDAGYMQTLIKRGADVIVAGETDNLGFRFATEQNIPVIELSHEVSENPGIRQFSEELQQKIPELKIYFFENKQIWEMI